MKKNLLLAIGFALFGLLLNSCDNRELPLERVPVPFTFVVNQAIADTGALVNTAENFSVDLTINPSFNGDKSKRKFTLNVSFLNGAQGDLVIGSQNYSSGMDLAQGTTAIKYTPTAAGKQWLVFEAKNEVGEIHKDTAYFNVAAYVPVPYTLTVTPKTFLGNNRPGTQQDVDIKVTSSDLTGSMTYTLQWTTNGAASIYFNNTTAFVQPGTIAASDNNLKLNIPGGHPDGNYWLAVIVRDANGDTKKDTIKYKVAANVAPTITSASSVYQYTGSATGYNEPGGAGWTCGGSPFGGCYVGPMVPNMGAAWAAPYQIHFTVNGADSDGSVAGWKVTIGSTTQTGTTSVPTFTCNVNANKVYYAQWKLSTSGGCSGPAYKYALAANATTCQGSPCSCSGHIPDYTFAPGATVTIQVQDNEGVWSNPYYVVLDDATWFTTNAPTGLQ